jgi:phenylpyruvate tautomerase PptA (4-oxalocrotonate tautomerase family)
MPLLSIETNQAITETDPSALLEAASRLVADMLGKSEAYVMVKFSHNPNMMFAHDRQPLALLQLKSIALNESQTGELSAALCELMDNHLGIAGDRIYIEFSDVSRAMWGFNGGTF